MTRKTLILALILTAAATCAETYNPTLWSGMKYRMIGPERGGRVTTVTGVPSQPHTFYMGSTGGGVWKTTDAGHSWSNISDGFFSAASMGAIDVSLSRPQHHLRRHRLLQNPQQRLHRPRHLQIHRRRQDLDLHRPPRRRPDRHHPHPPHQPRHRLRRRAGQSLRRRPNSAASTKPPTAARPGKTSSSSPT